MEDVVDEIAQEYLEGVKIKAAYISARCPFHGVDRHPSFWMERATGKFGCWACGTSGSGLEWFLKELGVRKRSIDHVIKEAKKDRKHKAKIAQIQKRKKARADFLGTHTLPENILGLWDLCPMGLVEAGFSEEVLQQHDIGFDKERSRITFPIRDIAGSLIGISGRSVDGSHPKYKVYQGKYDRVDDNGEVVPSLGELGEWFPNYSSTDIRNHLYRGNFVYQRLFDEGGDQLIIVEGYKAALWLVQLGYENVVALMGSRMSQTQERLIRRIGVPTYVLLDNNDAGQSGADYVCGRLGRCIFPVYRCLYSGGQNAEAQPDDLADEEVEEMFQTAPRVAGKLRRSRR